MEVGVSLHLAKIFEHSKISEGQIYFSSLWNQERNVLGLKAAGMSSGSPSQDRYGGAGLKTQVSLEILSNLTDQTLERQFADQEFGRFLVTTDLTESDGTGMIPMGFLDSTGGWGRFAGSLGCQLFLGCLASGSFL